LKWLAAPNAGAQTAHGSHVSGTPANGAHNRSCLRAAPALGE
jgi:hypothetical protein